MRRRAVSIASFCIAALAPLSPDRGQASLPETPAGTVFRDFLVAYNSGARGEVEAFVRAHYAPDPDRVRRADRVLAGPLLSVRARGDIREVTINDPLDIEVWVHGTVSQAEFILREEEHTIRGVGLLQGMLPPAAITPAADEAQLLARIERYLETNVGGALPGRGPPAART